MILFPWIIYSNYDEIHKKAVRDKTSSQRFHFKSIIWAFICVFGYVLLFMTGVYAHNLLTFGFQWRSEYAIVYKVIAAVVILLALAALIVSIIIVKSKGNKNKLIPIPFLFYRVLCQRNPVPRQPLGCIQNAVLYIWQIMGVWISLATSVSWSFFTCGMVIAVFASPVVVITKLAIYISVVLLSIFAFAFLFEKVEELRNESKAIQLILIFIFLAAIFFIIVFGYTAILFFGNINTLGFITDIAKIIPIVLVTGISWVMKKELQKYKTDESSTSNSESDMTTQGTNTPPDQGILTSNV